MRMLSSSFIESLINGDLVQVIKVVEQDPTLNIEIRKDSINVYYRGGNALRIDEIKSGTFQFYFDRKYITDKIKQPINLPTNEAIISTESSVSEWVDRMPLIKHVMDVWFSSNPKEERVFQQVVVYDNNYSTIAHSTDYFICDIEYANRFGRFDMVAVKWPSSASERKRVSNLRLALIEMKYGDGAINGDSGLLEHINGLTTFLRAPENITLLKEEMISSFNTKKKLNILKDIKEILNFSDEKPEVILLLANHDPAKGALCKALMKIVQSQTYTDFCKYAELKIATSCFMGYGLYQEYIHPIENFLAQNPSLYIPRRL